MANNKKQRADFELDWGDIYPTQEAKNAIPKKEYESFSFKNEPGGRKLIGNIAQALGGGLTGLAQGGSNIGANIAQFPSDIYSYITGKEGYHAPKPDIKEFGPQSELGQQFEHAGEFAAPFVFSPALTAEAALGGAMFGGKLLPRLAADVLGGSAEDENRLQGAALGALAPLAGKAYRFVKETPFTKSGAVKNLNKAHKLAGQESHGIPLDLDVIRNLEYQMTSPHLRANKMNINTLMGKAAQGDYPSYFALQSALGDISRELIQPSKQKSKGIMDAISNFLSKPQSSAAERLTGKELENIRRQYIEDTAKYLNKQGKGKIPKLEAKGREDYRRYQNFLPYRNKALLAALGGVPGIKYMSHIINHD